VGLTCLLLWGLRPTREDGWGGAFITVARQPEAKSEPTQAAAKPAVVSLSLLPSVTSQP
jgi:hypothetical protein